MKMIKEKYENFIKKLNENYDKFNKRNEFLLIFVKVYLNLMKHTKKILI